MSSVVKLSGEEFDSMVLRGAFDDLKSKKVELINGSIRFMSPAGPLHDELIRYLTSWSVRRTTEAVCSVQVQSGFACDDDRPEPDILWLAPRRYGSTRPKATDVLLLIEVADSSLQSDLGEKASIYAQARIAEYWVVDVANQTIHVMRDVQSGKYQSTVIHSVGAEISPQCYPQAVLSIRDLFDFE